MANLVVEAQIETRSLWKVELGCRSWIYFLELDTGLAIFGLPISPIGHSRHCSCMGAKSIFSYRHQKKKTHLKQLT